MTTTTNEIHGPVRAALEADLAARAEADELLGTVAGAPRASTVETARQLADRLDYEQTAWINPVGPSLGLPGDRKRTPTSSQTIALYKEFNAAVVRLGL